MAQGGSSFTTLLLGVCIIAIIPFSHGDLTFLWDDASELSQFNGKTCDDIATSTGNDGGSCSIGADACCGEIVMHITDTDPSSLGFLRFDVSHMPLLSSEPLWETSRSHLYGADIKIRLSYPTAGTGPTANLVLADAAVAIIHCPSAQGLDQLLFDGGGESGKWWSASRGYEQPRTSEVHEYVGHSIQPAMYIPIVEEYLRVDDMTGPRPSVSDVITCLNDIEALSIRWDLITAEKTVQLDHISILRGLAPPHLEDVSPAYLYRGTEGDSGVVTISGSPFDDPRFVTDWECDFDGTRTTGTVVDTHTITCPAPVVASGVFVTLKVCSPYWDPKDICSDNVLSMSVVDKSDILGFHPKAGTAAGGTSVTIQTAGLQGSNVGCELWSETVTLKGDAHVISDHEVVCVTPKAWDGLEVQIQITEDNNVHHHSTAEHIYTFYDVYAKHVSSSGMIPRSGGSSFTVALSHVPNTDGLTPACRLSPLSNAHGEEEVHEFAAEEVTSEGVVCTSPKVGGGYYHVFVALNGQDWTRSSTNLVAYGVQYISPRGGTTEGGTPVTVSGTGFSNSPPVRCQFGDLSPVGGTVHEKDGIYSIVCLSPSSEDDVSSLPLELSFADGGYTADHVTFAYYGVTKMVPTKGHREGSTKLTFEGHNLDKDDIFHCHFSFDMSGSLHVKVVTAHRDDDGVMYCYTPAFELGAKDEVLVDLSWADGLHFMNHQLPFTYSDSGDELAKSDFDSGDDDSWTVVYNNELQGHYRPHVDTTNHCLSVTDGSLSEQGAFVAPDKFTSHAVVAYDSDFKFDLSISCDGCVNRADQAYVTLHSKTGAALQYPIELTVGEENHYSIPLREDGGWLHQSNEARPTQKEYLSVLQSLIELRVQWDNIAYSDTTTSPLLRVCLDNVAMSVGKVPFMVSSVAPDTVPQSGGISLTVIGSGFETSSHSSVSCVFEGVGEYEGELATTPATVVDRTTLLCASPQLQIVQSVKVQLMQGAARTNNNVYLKTSKHLHVTAYRPQRLPANGVDESVGRTVSVSGTGFDTNIESYCNFGDVKRDATYQWVDTHLMLTCVAPLFGMPGTVDLTVTVGATTSNSVSFLFYNYTGPVVDVQLEGLKYMDSDGVAVVNANERNVLHGTVESFISDWDPNLTFEWAVKHGPGLDLAKSSTVLTSTDSEYLVIAKDALDSGVRNYVFEFTGGDEGSTETVEFPLRVNVPPTDGSCALFGSESGGSSYATYNASSTYLELKSTFKVTCTDWVDGDSDSTPQQLKYKIGYMAEGGSAEVVLSTKKSPEEVEGGTRFSLEGLVFNAGKIVIMVHVYDRRGAETVLRFGVVIQVSDESVSSVTAISSLIASAESTVSSTGEYEEAARTCVVALSTLNTLYAAGNSTQEERAQVLPLLSNMASSTDADTVSLVATAVSLVTHTKDEMTEDMITDSLGIIEQLTSHTDVVFTDDASASLVSSLGQLLQSVQPVDDDQSTNGRRRLWTLPWNRKKQEAKQQRSEQKEFTRSIFSTLKKVAKDTLEGRVGEEQPSKFVSPDAFTLVSQRATVYKLSGAEVEIEGVRIKFPTTLFDQYVETAGTAGKGATYLQDLCGTSDPRTRARKCVVDVSVIIWNVNPYSYRMKTTDEDYDEDEHRIVPLEQSSKVVSVFVKRKDAYLSLSRLDGLTDPVQITLPTSDLSQAGKNDTVTSSTLHMKCFSWDDVVDDWSETESVIEGSSGEYDCVTSHLSSFALHLAPIASSALIRSDGNSFIRWSIIAAAVVVAFAVSAAIVFWYNRKKEKDEKEKVLVLT